MTETAFPVNDLLRRRLQTGLTILSLTACVASTLFLLVFSSQLGFGIAATTQTTLTTGISLVFGQFLLFIGLLIFAVGAVIVAFIVHLMMAQRTKDFGLMKSAGCPNSLVFGYFMTQLLGITFIGCVLGVIIGYVVDYFVINMGAFQVYNSAPNFWFAPLVFVAYFVFALIFGARPILKAAQMSPMKALSAVQYFGLTRGAPLKPLSRIGLTIKIASRSLFRRKSTTVRITVFISIVFLLLTVSIAGGIIANDTSTSWVTNAIGKNTLLIADQTVADQYTQRLAAFSEGKITGTFNFSDPNFAIPSDLIEQLNQTTGIDTVDQRLVWQGTIEEQGSFTIDPDTLATRALGDHRTMDCLVVGVDFSNMVSTPSLNGQFLNSSSAMQAVVGDSVARAIYSPIVVQQAQGTETINSDPLRQRVIVNNASFQIVGVCLDPFNNGNITYLSLENLQEVTNQTAPNMVLISLSSQANYQQTLTAIKTLVADLAPQLTVIELGPVIEQNINFLSSLWGIILFLPAFALASAALSLVSYLMLTIDEQRQEFAILRATGAQPKNILSMLAVQSLIVLLASFGVGTALGTILCILVLTTQPVVSVLTVGAISGWLLTALLVMFLVSLYPAMQFAKRPLLKIMS